MKNWAEPEQILVPGKLKEVVGGHPLVAEILVRRGFKDVQSAKAFLDPSKYTPTSPFEMPGMETAVERIWEAIHHHQLIGVWGDFDVDGQTATTLLLTALKALGGKVSYHIPVRETESHGINLPKLEDLIQQGVKLLVTCDTGIAAHPAIDFANAHQVEVVVTDHHDLPITLPAARALVNPRLLADTHPLANLPGVGVAYKLVEGLYQGENIPFNEDTILDLVALGIVADLAEQRGETRYLLQRGLKSLRATERMGLQIMMDLTGLEAENLTEEHIGYVLGPRLNALGRLSDASLGVELLTTADLNRARILAHEIEALNARRKLLTDQVFQAARSQIERDPNLLEGAALVLFHPTWPSGVIGIVASRLVEHYQRPTILIAAPSGETARGSARSIEGLNISAAIAAQKEMLMDFGGHPMAAGLSISPERIPDFRRALSKTVHEMLVGVTLEPRIGIDGYLSLGDLTLDLVKDLERLSPFGAGNPSIIMVSKGMILKGYTPVGRNDEHLQLEVESPDGSVQQLIWWNGAGWPRPKGKFDLAYTARSSNFRGQQQVQIEWIDAHSWEEPSIQVSPEALRIQVVDYRQKPQPRSLLDHLRAKEEFQVWCEGKAKEELGGQDRYALTPSKILAIWTTPPDASELRSVLERVSPQIVYLFAIPPHTQDLQSFLTRLSGLVKYALTSKGGRVSISSLTANTAQREASVHLGIAWLQAKGHIKSMAEDTEEMLLIPGDQAASADLPRITTQLRLLLNETAAYRTYYSQAEADSLINLS